MFREQRNNAFPRNVTRHRSIRVGNSCVGKIPKPRGTKPIFFYPISMFTVKKLLQGLIPALGCSQISNWNFHLWCEEPFCPDRTQMHHHSWGFGLGKWVILLTLPTYQTWGAYISERRWRSHHPILYRLLRQWWGSAAPNVDDCTPIRWCFRSPSSLPTLLCCFRGWCHYPKHTHTHTRDHVSISNASLHRLHIYALHCHMKM